MLLLCEPKELELRRSTVSIVEVSPAGPHCFVTLQADGFAPYVWLRHRDDAVLEIDDNFFHMRPGERRSIRMAHARSLGEPEELMSQLVVTSLGMWASSQPDECAGSTTRAAQPEDGRVSG